MKPVTASWDEALTALEAELDRVERILSEGPVEDLADPTLLDGMAPGRVAGVLPLKLADRAARARARTDALVAAVSERKTETARSLRATGAAARRAQSRRVPAFLDERS